MRLNIFTSWTIKQHFGTDCAAKYSAAQSIICQTLKSNQHSAEDFYCIPYPTCYHYYYDNISDKDYTR